jgi:hypothetical protein
MEEWMCAFAGGGACANFVAYTACMHACMHVKMSAHLHTDTCTHPCTPTPLRQIRRNNIHLQARQLVPDGCLMEVLICRDSSNLPPISPSSAFAGSRPMIPPRSLSYIPQYTARISSSGLASESSVPTDSTVHSAQALGPIGPATAKPSHNTITHPDDLPLPPHNTACAQHTHNRDLCALSHLDPSHIQGANHAFKKETKKNRRGGVL